jgi:DNA-binding response OmpR family regulator
LEEEGHEVIAVEDGGIGFGLASTQHFDCLILDWLLPGRDGLEIVKALRAAGKRTPTIILTARGGVEDRVSGLDSGADDYLPKPFAFAELLARIRVCLRRGPASGELVIRAGDLELDCVHRRLHRAGQEIELTAREFELLEFLIRHKNQVVTRDMIAREVWREPTGSMTNVIDVYVNYLRRKIERFGGQQVIETVRGVGYCLRE